MAAEVLVSVLLAIVLGWRPSRLLVPADASPQRVFVVTMAVVTALAAVIFALLRWWRGG